MTLRYSRFSRLATHAFTLIEMLAVVVIVGSLLVVAVPAISSVLSATRLRDAGDVVYNRLLEAQQLAITLGTETEVRIPLEPDPDNPAAGTQLRTIQIFAVRSDESAPSGVALSELGQSARLPDGVVISSLPAYTSLSKLPAQSRSDGTRDTYFAFRFHPDGSTDLDSNRNWFLTVVDQRIAGQAQTPKNFITIQIDPATGSLRRFQPGIR